MTERSFPALRNAGTFPLLSVLILTALLLGCGEEVGSRPVHFVEVSNPTQVANRYGEDSLEDLLTGLVRSEETTYVIVANHAEGQVIRFPADMWLWNRWGRLSTLQGKIRKAAAATTTTDDYRQKLHKLSKKVYGEIERPVLVRNTDLGGWSSLKKCAGVEALGHSEGEEVQVPEPNLGTPSSWVTILGSWLWAFGVIAGIILVGYGWRRLGEKARKQDH